MFMLKGLFTFDVCYIENKNKIKIQILRDYLCYEFLRKFEAILTYSIFGVSIVSSKPSN